MIQVLKIAKDKLFLEKSKSGGYLIYLKNDKGWKNKPNLYTLLYKLDNFKDAEDKLINQPKRKRLSSLSSFIDILY